MIHVESPREKSVLNKRQNGGAKNRICIVPTMVNGGTCAQHEKKAKTCVNLKVWAMAEKQLGRMIPRESRVSVAKVMPSH